MIIQTDDNCYHCETNDICPAFMNYTEEEKLRKHHCCDVELDDMEERTEVCHHCGGEGFTVSEGYEGYGECAYCEGTGLLFDRNIDDY